jgi:WD40 repeat protein
MVGAMQKSSTEHTNFVNCVRFSPNGDRFVSVGSDQKVISPPIGTR